jgi:hypothetical protein
MAYRLGWHRHFVLGLRVLMYALTTIDRGIIMALIEPLREVLGFMLAQRVGMAARVESRHPISDVPDASDRARCRRHYSIPAAR